MHASFEKILKWIGIVSIGALVVAAVFSVFNNLKNQRASVLDANYFLNQVPNAKNEQSTEFENTNKKESLYSSPANHKNYLNAAYKLIYAGYLGTASIESGDPNLIAFRGAVIEFQKAH